MVILNRLNETGYYPARNPLRAFRLELFGEADEAGPDLVFLAAFFVPEPVAGLSCLFLFKRSRHSWLGVGGVLPDVCFACASLAMGLV